MFGNLRKKTLAKNKSLIVNFNEKFCSSEKKTTDRTSYSKNDYLKFKSQTKRKLNAIDPRKDISS